MYNVEEKGGYMKEILLEEYLNNDDFNLIVKEHYQVQLSNDVIDKINKASNLVNKWVDQKKVMYGITTGFGVLCDQLISKEDALQLQENILLSHALSIGQPLPISYVRGMMLMVVKNVSTGYTGVSLNTIQRYIDYLNLGITPYVPQDGSVGYLALEAHMALTLIGQGQVYYQGKLYETKDLLNQLNIQPIKLSYKEGLSLISGTTCVTGIANVSIFNIKHTMIQADIIGALSLEINQGTLKAFDQRLMSVRPHQQQANTAYNVREILKDSIYAQSNIDYRLQDALSIRCIPQLHGAAKSQIRNTLDMLDIETNACTDNPIIYPIDDDGLCMSGCNPDSSYVGMAMDACNIAMANIAKMSERRNNRLIDQTYSQFPSFLIKNPGLNSGLMIPQYTQAGLLTQMRTLAYPSSFDNTPTCNNQEDYIASGYNSVLKSIDMNDKLNYILAIELLSIYHATQFLDTSKLSSSTQAIIKHIKQYFPYLEKDVLLHKQVEVLKDLLDNQVLINLVKEYVDLKFL